MHGRVLLAAFAALLASTALLSPAATAGGRATTFVVNDDSVGKGACKAPNFNTIQAAVDAAAPGDTITVCPGSYGPATVSKSVRIVGPSNGLKSKQCLDPVKRPASDPGVAAVVEGPGTAAFAVGADNVRIAGLTIQGSDIGVQVTGDAVANTRVEDNVFQNNTMGVYLRGQTPLYDGNCFRTNNRAGSASGNGMYTDPGTGFHNSTISDNTFLGNDSTAINLNGDGSGSTSDVLIKGNWSQNDGDFVSLDGTQFVQIRANTAPFTNGGSVVFVQSANFGITIQNNEFSGGEEGVSINSDGGEPNYTVVVSRNVLTENGAGVLVAPESLFNGLIYKNEATDNAVGVAIIFENYVQIVGNNLKGNGEIDCLDFNPLGAITLWHDNKGLTQIQDGLCEGATTIGP